MFLVGLRRIHKHQGQCPTLLSNGIRIHLLMWETLRKRKNLFSRYSLSLSLSLIRRREELSHTSLKFQGFPLILNIFLIQLAAKYRNLQGKLIKYALN